MNVYIYTHTYTHTHTHTHSFICIQVLPIDWLALRDYYHYGKGRAARRAVSARGARDAGAETKQSTAPQCVWMMRVLRQYACVYTNMRETERERERVCILACTYACMYARMYVRTYACMHACMHTHTHTHAYGRRWRERRGERQAPVGHWYQHHPLLSLLTCALVPFVYAAGYVYVCEYV